MQKQFDLILYYFISCEAEESVFSNYVICGMTIFCLYDCVL